METINPGGEGVNLGHNTVNDNLTENFQQGVVCFYGPNGEPLKRSDTIQLNNGKKLSQNDVINGYFRTARDMIIEKYGFNEREMREFDRGLKGIDVRNSHINLGINFCAVPGEPGWYGSSNGKLIHSNDYSDVYPATEIYINPENISNTVLFLATLFHELDHYAFFLRRFNRSNILNLPKERRGHEIDLFYQEGRSELSGFKDELLARADTADLLLRNGVDNDKVWDYGPGHEQLTTGESFYAPSIEYAQNFLKFQIGLYNLLARQYGLEGEKSVNQQLPYEANKKFQDFMEKFRNNILNSNSVERTKGIIHTCCNKLRESNSREDFYYKITHGKL